MRIHIVCGYRSKSDDWTEKWTDGDWRARNLVQALKGEAFKGYSDWTDSTTKKQYRVESTSAGREAATMVAVVKIRRLLAAAGINGGRIVPVPSSKHVAPGPDFTGGRLAEAIARADRRFSAQPILYFASPQLSARKGGGGSRRWQDILPHLRGGALSGAGPVILLDDVLTSGGHLRACARFLALRGTVIADAVVVARTVWAKPENMFDMPVETLDL